MTYDVIIIGGGQAALSVAYFLRRTSCSVLILDAEKQGGGAWQHGWDSLRLFSPASWSSIAGWPMPKQGPDYPSRDDIVAYLQAYEARYAFHIERPVHVTSVTREDNGFEVRAKECHWNARAVVNATGTWRKPFVPSYEGSREFSGVQLHSARYRNPEPFRGQRLAVVGGGNSGAQIFAEVSKAAANAVWVTQEEPSFLADNVDGRVLFERATAQWQALQEGRTVTELPGGFGDIVMVPPVVEARSRGVLKAVRPFARMIPEGVAWRDGSVSTLDAVVWCTGFRPVLDHLTALGFEDKSQIKLQGTRAVDAPGMWLVGYGDWTGPASATLVGVMRTARKTVEEIQSFLAS